jgi:hypothetical protein
MTKFKTLDFLCGLLSFVGTLVVVGTIVVAFLGILVLPQMGLAGTNRAGAFGAGAIVIVPVALVVIFIGLMFIATSQVFQCLMQIEINTRHEEVKEFESGPLRLNLNLPAVTGNCPKCGSGKTEIYERSRDGVGWICRACSNTWLVSTEQALKMQKEKLEVELAK